MKFHFGAFVADHHKKPKIGNYQRIDLDFFQKLKIIRKAFYLVVARNGIAGNVNTNVASVRVIDGASKIRARKICDGGTQRKLFAADIDRICAVFNGVTKSCIIPCGRKQFRLCKVHIIPQKNGYLPKISFIKEKEEPDKSIANNAEAPIRTS